MATEPEHNASSVAPQAGPPDPAEPTLSLRIFETLQTLLTALILAFVFRAFFVEAFVIPTGSMAEGLLGVHGTVVCPRCAWEFNFGPDHNHRPEPTDDAFVPPDRVVCPNCLYELPQPDAPLPPCRAGDRILVIKWPYLLGGPLGPQRWDLVVFRDPAQAEQSFIKRLVGLPGETVEIIDGDVFIDGRIARKTTVAQQALWRLVHDQRYPPPVDREHPSPLRWVAEQQTVVRGPGWRDLEQRRLQYWSDDLTPRRIVFAPDLAIRNRTGYGLGYSSDNVGDVRLSAELDWRGGIGWLHCELARGEYRFRGALHGDGRAVLEITRDTQPPQWRAVATGKMSALAGKRVRIELVHLDYEVAWRVGELQLKTTAADYAPDLELLRTRMISAPVELTMVAAQADFTLRDVRVDRDVYYTYDPRRNRRAEAGRPMQLREDEYFVLGDNSAFSHDSRSWDAVDPFVAAYYGREATGEAWPYRTGVVRQDLMLGQASLVYLPGLLPLSADGQWRMIDIGRVRFAR